MLISENGRKAVNDDSDIFKTPTQFADFHKEHGQTITTLLISENGRKAVSPYSPGIFKSPDEFAAIYEAYGHKITKLLISENGRNAVDEYSGIFKTPAEFAAFHKEHGRKITALLISRNGRNAVDPSYGTFKTPAEFAEFYNEHGHEIAALLISQDATNAIITGRFGQDPEKAKDILVANCKEFGPDIMSRVLSPHNLSNIDAGGWGKKEEAIRRMAQSLKDRAAGKSSKPQYDAYKVETLPPFELLPSKVRAFCDYMDSAMTPDQRRALFNAVPDVFKNENLRSDKGGIERTVSEAVQEVFLLLQKDKHEQELRAAIKNIMNAHGQTTIPDDTNKSQTTRALANSIPAMYPGHQDPVNAFLQDVKNDPALSDTHPIKGYDLSYTTVKLLSSVESAMRQAYEGKLTATDKDPFDVFLRTAKEQLAGVADHPIHPFVAPTKPVPPPLPQIAATSWVRSGSYVGIRVM